MKVLGKEIDERFWTHRRRSTSIAGIVCAVTSIVLFEYRYFVQHRAEWDLLIVGLVFLVIKLALLTWFHFTD